MAKILVIDSVESTRSILNDILLMAGHECAFSPDIELGSGIIGKQGFDLIIFNTGTQAESLDDPARSDKVFTGESTELQDVLEGVIFSLTMAVEYRDPYTSSHQSRVADLAVAIAKEVGFSSNDAAGVCMAGKLHDIGKMAIPVALLCKPGRLSEAELDLIRTHPQAGYDILSSIKFPWPLAEIVLQHHERIDGSGYPNGLLGEDMLIESRILGVADVVEAMASHRPYRAALGIDKALEEILSNRGEFYDKGVVDACLCVFKEKGFSFNLEQNRYPLS